VGFVLVANHTSSSTAFTPIPCAIQQVKTVEFHPVQPWIAFADKGDGVKVWDWSTQQVCAARGVVLRLTLFALLLHLIVCKALDSAA